ncbi:MAG: hypothetical protein ACJ71U_21730 [Terriglobales bacterium]
MAWLHRKSPSAHWSKDYIEHLRTIHFALIAACVAAWIIGGAPDTYRIRAAQRQLRTIQDFLKNRAPKWQQQDRDDLFLSAVTARIDGVDYAIRVPSTFEVVEPSCPAITNHSRLTVGQAGKVFSKIDRLQDFETTWNGMICSKESVYMTLLVASTLTVTADIREFGNLPKNPKSFDFKQVPASLSETIPRGAISLDLLLGDNVVQQQTREQPTRSHIKFMPLRGPRREFPLDPKFDIGYFSGTLGNYVVVLYVELSPGLTVEPVHSLLQEDEPQWACDKSFSECFPELQWFSSRRKNYRLQDLQDSIDDQVAGFQPHDFEALGIKFPIEDQARWGILLLVALCIYLWLHLRELSPKIASTEEGLNVAWVGIYPSIYARVLTWATILFVPVLSIVVLAQSGLRYESPLRPFVAAHWHQAIWWLVLPAAIATVCSLGSCIKVTRLATQAAQKRNVSEDIEKA